MSKFTSRQRNQSQKTILQRFGMFFFDRPRTTFVFWISLVVFGLLSYTVLLQRQGFPNVEVPISIVSGTYFVNDKNKVDEDVVKKVAETIVAQGSVKTITSSTGDNFFTVVISYKDGVKAAAASNAIEKAVQAENKLPEGAKLSYKALNAGKLDNEYDVLLAVYDPAIAEPKALQDRAAVVAGVLSTAEGVDSTKVLEQNGTGLNPTTGQTVSIDKNFDRVGIVENGAAKYYPSVTIGVKEKSSTDAIHLEKHLKAIIESRAKSGVDGTARTVISAGFADNIKTQINNLQTNLIEGLIVVIIVSLMLISWRAGLATALSMATVLLITIGLLYAFGLTLNTITLFALVLCLGLIVDDTTIMAEAIDAGKYSDKPQREIVSTAIKKVARASTAGTIVTMLAFAPMLFIGGILGTFIRVLPITIILSLAVSLIVSLTLIPFLSRFLILTKNQSHKKSINPVVRLESWTSNSLANLVRVGKRSRLQGTLIGLFCIAISFGFLIASGPFFKKLKFDIFPATKDGNQISINLKFDNGITVPEAAQRADRVDVIVAATLGDNFRKAAYMSSGDAQSAIVTVDLKDFKKRDIKSPELVRSLQIALDKETGFTAKVNQNDAGPPKDDLPFRVQLYGEDTSKTIKLAEDIKTFLINRDIKRLSNGTTSKITRVSIEGKDNTLTRVDAKRVIEVRAGYDATDTSALVTATQTSIEDEFNAAKVSSYGLQYKDTVKYNFGNESSNQDSFKSMIKAFPILLLVMYILLLVQFKSMLQPLLIFMAIPFSFFGVAAGLYETDNPLSFFVMIGFFALIGIAVNNTILLTDFANQSRNAGMGTLDSVAEAIKARFRPLITTSLTSVVALVPLALSDPFWESLSYTLIFGLLSSTILVVVAFPYYYLAVEVIHRANRWFWKKLRRILTYQS